MLVVITYQETALRTLRGTVRTGAPLIRRVRKQFEASVLPPSPHTVWAVPRRVCMVICDIIPPLPPSRKGGAPVAVHGD